jgi:hypothetical protein
MLTLEPVCIALVRDLGAGERSAAALAHAALLFRDPEALPASTMSSPYEFPVSRLAGVVAGQVPAGRSVTWHVDQGSAATALALGEGEDALKLDAESIGKFRGYVDRTPLVSVFDASERVHVHTGSLAELLARELLPHAHGLQGAVGAAS